jgi:hypothetical protein
MRGAAMMFAVEGMTSLILNHENLALQAALVSRVTS